jgi:hypothetical protein
METQEKDSKTELIQLVNRFQYFTKLKPDPKNGELFIMELKVSGYNEVKSMLADILKVSILALENDPPYVSRTIQNPEINVMGLLEIAVQLLPHGEMELLDEVHQFYLNQENEANSKK